MGHHDAPSPSGDGSKSVVSDPMDEFISYEELFDGFLENLKGKYRDGTVTQLEPDQILLAPHIVIPETIEVRELSEEELEMAKTQISTMVRLDKDRGEFVLVSYRGMELLSTTFVVLHQQPLVLEYWVEDGKRRDAGKAVAANVQKQLDSIIGRLD